MTTSPPAGPPAAPSGVLRPVLVTVAAWAVPGSGHLILRKPRRAAVVFGVVLFSFLFGCWLRGHLYVVVPEQPLSRLATLSSMGAGAPYFVARYLVEYSGDVLSSTFRVRQGVPADCRSSQSPGGVRRLGHRQRIEGVVEVITSTSP